MNWLKLVLTIFSLAPSVIQGINNIAAEKDHASKRQMAHDALLLGSGVAQVVDPKDTETIQAVSDLTHKAIDLHLGPAPVAQVPGV